MRITERMIGVALLVVSSVRGLLRSVLTSNRKLDVSQAGWRGRLALATLCMTGFFQGLFGQEGKRPPHVTCYKPTMTQPPKLHGMAALKAAWRALDPVKGEAFKKAVEEAVAAGEVEQGTADLLALAFQELAFHKVRTRTEAGQRVTCYEMTMLGGAMSDSRENALQQLELLAKARSSGKLDPETAERAREVIARELAFLERAKPLLFGSDWKKGEALGQDRAKGRIGATKATKEAAAQIVRWES